MWLGGLFSEIVVHTEKFTTTIFLFTTSTPRKKNTSTLIAVVFLNKNYKHEIIGQRIIYHTVLRLQVKGKEEKK